jgi:hypothetical protein
MDKTSNGNNANNTKNTTVSIMENTWESTINLIHMWNIMINVICNYALKSGCIIFGGAARDIYHLKLNDPKLTNSKYKKIIDGDIDIMADDPEKFITAMKKEIKYYQFTTMTEPSNDYSVKQLKVQLPPIFDCPYEHFEKISVKIDIVKKKNFQVNNRDFNVNRLGIQAFCRTSTYNLKNDFTTDTSFIYFDGIDNMEQLVKDLKQKKMRLLRVSVCLDNAANTIKILNRLHKMLQRGWKLAECQKNDLLKKNNEKKKCVSCDKNNHEHLVSFDNFNIADKKYYYNGVSFSEEDVLSFIGKNYCIECFIKINDKPIKINASNFDGDSSDDD